MDKTFSDLMDIVNRSKQYDTGTPKPRPKRVAPPVKEYAPREYDIVEEKPKRKTATKSSASSLSNSKLSEMVSKATKSTTKKATSTKSTTKTTAKKTAEKKTPAKSTSTKSTTTKKTTTKKATAPKTDKLSALMNKVSTPKTSAKPKEEKVEEKAFIPDTAPEVSEDYSAKIVKEPEVKVEEVKPTTKPAFPKFELPAARPKVKPAKSITDKEPTNNEDAQLYAALKNSLFGSGTDISEYLTADEVSEMTQQNYEDNFQKIEANKLNEEISKEQQEYEQLFTGSFSSFYDMADNEEENTETFERDERKPHDSTYELDTGSKNLDQKIADYYKRKQEMIEKYNAEEEDYIEEKKEDENAPIDYDAIFGGTIMSRDEVLGLKNRNEQKPAQDTETEDTTMEENPVFTEYLARNTDNQYGYEQPTTESSTEDPTEENISTEVNSQENVALDVEPTTQPVEEVSTSEPVNDNAPADYVSAFGTVESYNNTHETETSENVNNNTVAEPEESVVTGDNFVMTPSEQPAGEVMEYSNQVPVDFSEMTKVEDLVEQEDSATQPEERKSLLSAFVQNKTYQQVDDDDDEELVIKLSDNEYAIEDNSSIENESDKETTEEVVTTDNEVEQKTNSAYDLPSFNFMDDIEEESENNKTMEETTEETPNDIPPMFDAINTSLDDESSIVVDSENTVSSLELEESKSNTELVTEPITEPTTEVVDDMPLPDTDLSSEETEEESIMSDNLADAENNEEEIIQTPANNEAVVETEEVEETEEIDNTSVAEPVDNSVFTTEPVAQMNENNEDKELLETYLSEEEQYDYIVTNERLFEEQQNRTQSQTFTEEINTDEEDNTIVMNDIPSTTFDFFKSITEENKVEEQPVAVEPNYDEAPVEEETNVAENVTAETTTQAVEDDTISKDEFYREMARLQENIISELQGNKVEKSSYDFFAEKEEPKVEQTPVQTQQPIDSSNLKAQTLVDDLIAEAEEESTPSVVEQVLAKQQAENVQTVQPQVSSTAQQTVQAVEPVVENLVEEQPAEDSLVGSQAEPVDPADFDKYNLLNKTVALSEEDIKEPTPEVAQTKPDDYFYGSNEDKEKKAQVIDEYMTIYNEEAHSKEVGDINIFKNIGNATPSSEILKEEKVEPVGKMEKDEDGDLETIYTLMGIQRKQAAPKQKEIKVLYCASECQPFAASGGLADVAGSLPKAIAEKGGIDIRVIMPLYGNIKAEYRDKFEYLGNFTVHLSWRQEYCGLFRYFKDGVTYYFIDNERYFKRDTLYGYYDDGERFAYFSKAIVEALPYINFFPDIIHCNDWQTALVSAYVKTGNWSDHRYYNIRYVYTIHNVEYQGNYGMENLKDLFGIDYRFKNDVEYNGDINLTKTAIQYCDKLTTVSNSYCDNLKQPYCSRGLHHIIIRNEYKLSGIINGIDYAFYNPATDPNLFKNYDIGCLEEKVLNKKLWQDEIGLPVDGDTPMIAIVSRLVGHKGLDLVAKIVHNILQQDIQLVVVGTGDSKYVDLFHSLEQKYPTKVRAFVDKYSNEIARKAYAASDIFVMPSKIEPCGLSQMISSRYGSVPIVREVGGLKDTIRDFGCEGGGNGYTFANYNANDLQYQIERAIKDYSNRTQWREKMKICMSQDYTWGKPALSYIDLYKSISSN